MSVNEHCLAPNLRVTMHTSKGSRARQEDRFTVNRYESGLLVAVFDGHGGYETADLAAKELPIQFSELHKELPGDEALRVAIKRIAARTASDRTGSTVSAVFISERTNVAYGAVIGDSPILISNGYGAILKGADHNVRSNPAEAEAAMARGGIIESGYLFRDRYGDGLQMSRALGDSKLGDVILREPEMMVPVELGKDSFVLVATDGLFDPAHTTTHFAPIIKLIKDGATAAELVGDALARQTGDNVTAILVRMGE